MKNSGTLLNSSSERDIAITRVFHAPRAKLFEAWTKPELLKQWFLGPVGWSLPVCEVDLKVGGSYRYMWRRGDAEIGTSGVFQEIVRPEKIVHTEVFDEPWFPGTCVVTVTFVEHDGKTTVTSTSRFESQKARDIAMKTDIEKGVAASYARLDDLLS